MSVGRYTSSPCRSAATEGVTLFVRGSSREWEGSGFRSWCCTQHSVHASVVRSHLLFEEAEQEVEAVLGPELSARALRAVGHAAQQTHRQRPQLRACALPIC